jgi:hypothetical protein
MTRIKKAVLSIALILAVWFVAGSVFGQDTNTPPLPGPAPAPSGGLSGKLGQFQWVLVPVTTIIIMGVKKWVPAIPSQLYPWIAPLLGGALDWFGTQAGIWSGDALVGAAFGGLATWFHQLGSQTKELVSGPDPQKP